MQRLLVLAVAGLVSPLFAGDDLARVSPRVAHEIQAKDRNMIFLDVRSPSEFARGHVAGAVNIPSSEIRTATVPKAGLLVVYCPETSCSRSTDAAAALTARGCSNVRILDGGLEAWRRSGFPVEPKPASERVTGIFPVELRRMAESHKGGIIDARPSEEFISGHIPWAKNIPLENLPGALATISGPQQWIVYDRLQERAHKAALILAESGLEVRELVGGMAVWAKKGYPVAVGEDASAK